MARFACVILSLALAQISEAGEPVPKDYRDMMEAIRAKLAAFHQGEPDNGAVIKVVYFHPSDRDPLPNYAERLERVLTDVSSFYRGGLESYGVESKGIPFDRDAAGKINLRLVRGKHPLSHYAYDPKYGDETWAEVRQALGDQIDKVREHVLILCGLCEKASDGRYVFNSPYYGASWSDQRHGLCHAADCELLDTQLLTAKDRPMVFTEHYYQRKELSVAEFNSWYIGGIAHELGHGFGLPHDSGSPSEAGRGSSLMGSGNFHYREEFHGGTKPAFLSLATAIRVAASPLVTRSNKARWEDSKVVFRGVHATASLGKLVLTGTVVNHLPACAVIASIWPASAKEGQDHGAITFCSLVDPNGRFEVELTPPPSNDWNLKLGAVLANGAEPKVRTTFATDAQGVAQTDALNQWALKLEVDPVEQLLMRTPELAGEYLTDEAIAAASTDEARRRLTLLKETTKPEPEGMDLATAETSRAFVSDAKWTQAEVGWGKVARNHYFPNPGYWEGLLFKLNGKVYAKGLYAHAKSAYSFAIGGKWNSIHATVGLQDGATAQGSAIFIIEGDGRELARSKVLRATMSAPIQADLTGVNSLTLRVIGGEGHPHGCWAIWCDPLIEKLR